MPGNCTNQVYGSKRGDVRAVPDLGERHVGATPTFSTEPSASTALVSHSAASSQALRRRQCVIRPNTASTDAARPKVGRFVQDRAAVADQLQEGQANQTARGETPKIPGKLVPGLMHSQRELRPAEGRAAAVGLRHHGGDLRAGDRPA